MTAAVALVLLPPEEPGPPPPPPAASGAPVTETTLGCPQQLSRSGRSRTSYGAALADVEGLGSAGEVTPVALARGDSVDVPGSSQDPPVVRGSGELARGLVAWRADSGPATAVTGCPSPRASWWFTGLGATLDHRSTVVLANHDAGPAVVDLTVLSADGPVDVSETGGTGITLGPGERDAVSLAELAPQQAELAVQVRASRGRVVAAVTDRYAETPTAEPGIEWLPSQVTPQRTLRLAGVPARATSRTLLVANPSSREAVVTVELAGPSGRFVPAGLTDLSVGPGAVASLELPRVDQVFAVRLLADRPVTATLRSVVPGDLVYAGAAEPLTGPAALPAVQPSVLQLAAGGETTRAEVTAYSADGTEAGTARLTLAAHAADTWNVPARASYVVVQPVQGRVLGAVVYDAASAVQLRDLPVTVRVPVVRPTA